MGFNTSSVASATYTINGPEVVTVITNANGNITSIPPANSTANATFAYNNANRLASVTGSPIAATFVYDWQGQRYSKTDGGVPATVYGYAQGGTLIAENDNGSVTDYIYVDGRPIATLQPSATPAADHVDYIVTDRLGTPQIVTNTDGAAVWGTTYQPFGTTGHITASVNQIIRLPGQNMDTETGFSYNLNRDYMPNLGRYLEADPIGLEAGENPYMYAMNNPAELIDRRGLDVFFIGSSAGGGNTVGVSGGQGVVIDSSGTYGTYTIVGGGGADTGSSFFGGLNIGYLGSVGGDTTTITNLGGAFEEGSLGGGTEGGYFAGQLFADPNDPNHLGGSVTLGYGSPGVSGGIQTTYTKVCPKGTLSDLYDSILNGVIDLILVSRDAWEEN